MVKGSDYKTRLNLVKKVVKGYTPLFSFSEEQFKEFYLAYWDGRQDIWVTYEQFYIQFNAILQIRQYSYALVSDFYILLCQAPLRYLKGLVDEINSQQTFESAISQLSEGNTDWGLLEITPKNEISFEDAINELNDDTPSHRR